MSTRKLRKTHPADGKFYLTEAMLREQGACSCGIDAFQQAAHELGFHDPAAQVPVTQELVKRVMQQYRSASVVTFIIEIIGLQGRISPHRLDAFYRMNWWPDDYTELAGIAMDIIEHARHKRA